MSIFIVNILQRAKLKFTLVVNEDVTIKPVSEQQDIFRVFKVDVCSGEQVWVKTVDREEEVTNTFTKQKDTSHIMKVYLWSAGKNSK